MVERYFAIKRSDGKLMSRNNSGAPALYLTELNARNTVERNWPGIVSDGYEIIELVIKEK